ncbi:unnamed protein product [Ectocarpus fasciculatus]
MARREWSFWRSTRLRRSRVQDTTVVRMRYWACACSTPLPR